MTIAAPTPELSRPVALDDLADGEPLTLALEATPEERVALAGRLGVIEIRSLAAAIGVVRAGAGRLRVDIDYRADVVQCCVVTLEPVPATIEESFTQAFLRETPPSDGAAGANGEVRVDPGEEAETIEEDHLDVGELLAQCLSLALDPYPRKQGASFAGFTTAEGAPNAFAALGGIEFETAGKRRRTPPPAPE